MSSLISFKSKVLKWLRLERGGCYAVFSSDVNPPVRPAPGPGI
jgi:hypothetical protein